MGTSLPRPGQKSEDLFASNLKRGLLGFLTLGTSEIKTGSGKYHDETLADSLFPKAINDWALEDREFNRRKADAAAEAEANKPVGVAPDMADQILKKAGATSLLKAQAKNGRKSAFLAGALGDITKPLVKTGP